jgi:leader peptidase (prepilin peptidase)/N-methyltransferase
MPEVLCAAGFALSAWIGGGLLRVAAACWLVAFGLAAALVDAAIQRLPDVLTWPCLAGVVAFSCGQAAVSGSWPTVMRTIEAGGAVAGLFLVLALAFDVGMGDVKISASIGAALGYLSWGTVVLGCAAGFVLAGLYAAVSLATHRASLSAHLALGPFLLAGALLALAVSP